MYREKEARSTVQYSINCGTRLDMVVLFAVGWISERETLLLFRLLVKVLYRWVPLKYVQNFLRRQMKHSGRAGHLT